MFKFVLTFIFAIAAHAAVAQECISHTAEAGAVYGEAEFSGEPWVYSWVVDQDWNNDLGEWVKIDPIVHTLDVPGEAIQFRFTDGTDFIYGSNLTYHAKGDNLYTISHYGYGGEAGPYQAIRTVDGEIFLLDAERCEPVSWNLAN